MDTEIKMRAHKPRFESTSGSKKVEYKRVCEPNPRTFTCQHLAKIRLARLKGSIRDAMGDRKYADNVETI